MQKGIHKGEETDILDCFIVHIDKGHNDRW